MTKRFLSLLLILLIPCAFLSCREETPNVEPPDNEESAETPTEPENYGTLYTDESGRLQNDLITVEITNESLVAPVSKLTYNICNASACHQSAINVWADLEMKKDGEWVLAPPGMVIERVHRDFFFFVPPRIQKGEMDLGVEPEPEYYKLEPGEYRLVITFPILMPTEIQVFPTVEFTVVAPTE